MVILGPIADIAMQKLSTDMPEQFQIAGEGFGDLSQLRGGGGETSPRSSDPSPQALLTKPCACSEKLVLALARAACLGESG